MQIKAELVYPNEGITFSRIRPPVASGIETFLIGRSRRGLKPQVPDVRSVKDGKALQQRRNPDEFQ